MKPLPFKPEDELFRWGPVPGRIFFMSEFIQSIYVDFPKACPGHFWPLALMLLKQGELFWINDLFDFQEAGERVFIEHILPDERRQALHGQWLEILAREMAYRQRLDSLDLASLSQDEFVRIFEEYYRLATDFWTPTIAMELGNYGSDKLLEEKLGPYVDAKESGSVLEALTAPESLSFYQEEEIDLAETDDLRAHQQAYYWLKNSYAGTQVLSDSFFAERKPQLAIGLRQRMEQRLAEVRIKKQETIRKHGLPADVVAIAFALTRAIEWQDERKKQIFMSLHYKDRLMREVARRMGYEPDDLLNCDFQEITAILHGEDLHARLKARRTGFYAIISNRTDGSCFMDLQSPDAERMQELWDTYRHPVTTQQTDVLTGIVASQGKGEVVKGKVKILLDPHRLEDFQAGEVLVAAMTSPEYVFAMKKAVAVITDTGGLTSHAAIVSRELDLPCIVNTKFATKVLHDGDEVEVDAKNGTVKKLKTNNE